jgi:SNF2 family DNA or RNA helicase
MIILHAGYFDDQLLLWGETPPDRTGDQKPGKISGTLNPLPYNAGFKVLAQTLTAIEYESKIHKRDSLQPVLWVPSKGKTPFASSPLIDKPPSTRHKISIVPWQVTALSFDMEHTIKLLCWCMDKKMLAPGVVIGDDLSYWAAALRFAGSLVANEKFVPSIREDSDLLRAIWKPVLEVEDQNKKSQLAQAMPATCRAMTFDANVEPHHSAESVLSRFLQQTIDTLIRFSLRDHPLFDKTRRKSKPSFDSIHDQWLYALGSRDHVMEGTPEELAEFAIHVRKWQHPLSVSAETPFRLCFRLEEPPDELQVNEQQETWFVRYLLQDTADPSLQIPLDEAWNAKGKKAQWLTRHGFNPLEYMLLSLGQASGICPHIEASLKTQSPGGYELDREGTYTFLTERAGILEQMGFGVMLPAWWTRKGTKQRLSMKANVKSPPMQDRGSLSLDEMLAFQWEIALGGKTITLRELQQLAKMKSSLVKIRGQWMQINAEEIQEAIDFWKSKAATKAPLRKLVQMALGKNPTPPGVEFAGVSATGWIKDLLNQLHGKTQYTEIDIHEKFNGTLRPYQQKGYSWLNFLHGWGLGACLADDMGLGKTIQALALVQRNWHNNGKRPVLLICPTSVVNNWHREASRFTPELPIMIHHGITRKKGAAFKKTVASHAIVISSYALLHRDFRTLKEIFWAGVILDEAQNIKNPVTKQAQAARSLQANYRVALTGTPVENNVGDLWSIMEFLNPGFLGTQAEFKRSFFIPIQAKRDSDAIQRLKQITGPFILRRLKTDKSIIRDLPEKMEMKVFCNLTKEQASLYQAVVNDVAEELESAKGIQRKGLVLSTLSKLKQVCNHPAQFAGDNSPVPGRSGKLARLTEMLEEIHEIGERSLLFTQFSEMGHLLHNYLRDQFGQEVFFLHGGSSKKKRDQMVEQFQSDDGPTMFILSLKAGGTGLNLTKANHVFHFDRWWNPGVENQATDRAYRIGQSKNVQVHKFLCVGTLEEKIDEMIESKKEIAEGVVGAGEGWLTELSTDELKELFTLRKEAIAE